MEMYSTQGIILKKIDIGETDALFTIYTRDYGKIRALAQGIKKEGAKLKGHLETLNLSSIQFVVGKNGERLTHAEVLQHWTATRADIMRLQAAWSMANTIDTHCLIGEEDGNLWNFLLESFVLLDSDKYSEASAENFMLAFKEGLASVLGYADSAGLPSPKVLT